MKNDVSKELLPMLKKYKECVQKNTLLCIPFTTLTDYLWLLKGVCEKLSVLGSNSLLYLAAAVSDFYIPSEQMVLRSNTILIFITLRSLFALILLVIYPG